VDEADEDLPGQVFLGRGQVVVDLLGSAGDRAVDADDSPAPAAGPRSRSSSSTSPSSMSSPALRAGPVMALEPGGN
jgi:hypothetical protein